MSSQTSVHTPWLHTRGMPASCLGFGCFADAGLQLLLMSHGKGRAVLLLFFFFFGADCVKTQSWAFELECKCWGGRKVARFLPVPCLSLGFAGRDVSMGLTVCKSKVLKYRFWNW